MKKLLIAAISLALLGSCGQDKAAIEQAEKEVFAIHDEIMPQMGQLMEYKKTLSYEITALDSLLKIKANDSLQKRKDNALAISSTLQEADKGMMDWMHGFNADYDKLSHEEIMKYLNSEKGKIEQIEIKMKESIANAKTSIK